MIQKKVEMIHKERHSQKAARRETVVLERECEMNEDRDENWRREEKFMSLRKVR